MLTPLTSSTTTHSRYNSDTQPRRPAAVPSTARNQEPYTMRAIGHPSAENQQQSPLLRLPGELRNRIYKEVLSEPTVALLSRKSSENRREPPRLYAVNEGIPLKELNPLRYTCRQLYLETCGLGLEWNIINFYPFYDGSHGIDNFVVHHAALKQETSFDVMPATKYCARFLEVCHSSKLDQLKCLHVHERVGFLGFMSRHPFGFKPEYFQRLATFCTEHPKSEIKIYLKFERLFGWVFEGYADTLNEVLLLQHLARNHPLPPGFNGFNGITGFNGVSGVNVARKCWPLENPLPGNLRFCLDFDTLEDWEDLILKRFAEGDPWYGILMGWGKHGF